MGTSVGVGYSLNKNPADAGREAATQALQQGGIAEPDFVFVFATVGYNQQLLIQSIREATGNAPLSGCSGEGIIAPGVGVETNFGVCVMALASDELRFSNARVAELGLGPAKAGVRLAEELQPLLAKDTVACFLFADGLSFDYDPFREGFEGALSCAKPLPLFGGLAANNWTTRATYQYHDDEVLSRGISCVLMSGRYRVAWGVTHGCVPVGTRRTITRSKGNLILEIDGAPALEVLKEYVEEGVESQWNKMTLNLCLGFKTPDYLKEQYGEFMVRYMMDKNDSEGSVTIQSDVEDGAELWIMRRDKELIGEGLRGISRQIREQLGDSKPEFILHFECMGRGKVIFREEEKDELLNALQEAVGPDVPWIGFYGYGEIGPVSDFNCMHNFTAVVVAVY